MSSLSNIQIIRRKRVNQLSLGFSILITSLFSWMLYVSFSTINPDWLSYKYIYESGGAWLIAQGRDPIFITLTNALAGILGEDGYETYRIIFALYFVTFVMWLTSSSSIRKSRSIGGYAFLMIAIIYFGIARFTIQIREGLALTIVLYAITLLLDKQSLQYGPFYKGKSIRFSTIVSIVSMLLIAGLIHIATSAFLLIFVAAVWVTKRKKLINDEGVLQIISARRVRYLWLLALLFTTYSLAQFYLGGSLEQLATEAVGERLVDIKSLSVQQVVLWLAYGIICLIIYKETLDSIKENQVTGVAASFIWILTGPASFAAYITIAVALAMAINPLFISGYVRLLYMFLATSLLLLSLVGRRGWLVMVIGIFLIADQLRAITDSIEIYFGVKII